MNHLRSCRELQCFGGILAMADQCFFNALEYERRMDPARPVPGLLTRCVYGQLVPVIDNVDNRRRHHLSTYLDLLAKDVEPHGEVDCLEIARLGHDHLSGITTCAVDPDLGIEITDQRGVTAAWSLIAVAGMMQAQHRAVKMIGNVPAVSDVPTHILRIGIVPTGHMLTEGIDNNQSWRFRGLGLDGTYKVRDVLRFV